MRFKIFIFLVFCLLSMGLHAQMPEYNRHFSKSFRVSNDLSVEISNKYGRIHIIPWEQDSVKFIIDMRIRAKDNLKLEKMKQAVEFEFTPGQYFLVARTKFGDSGTDVFKDIVDIAGSYLSTANSVSINYTVMVPGNASLKIENKFGDVYLEDHQGAINLVLSYGDLKANRLNGRSEIKLASGDGEINYMKDGQVTLSYVNLHIRENLKLVLQSQSSVVNIDKTGTMKLNSRRDKIFLNDLGSLSGESYFSYLNLGIVHYDVTMNCRYGDLTLDNIQRSFSLLNLTTELTDLALAFERPMAFGFELTHNQAVTFLYPKNLAQISTKVMNAEEKIFSTTGNMGSGSPDSRVIIKAPRKCSITLIQK